MQPVVPPTLAANKHKTMLYFVLLVHFVLAILLLISAGLNGLFELINVMILWCGTSQMHFCYL